MDGKTALVSRAANMAASKGILVVNAAGNEGSGKWKTIGAPADADSVLAVGGINPNNEIHMDFGSYGPTADMRLKPNVSNYAKTVAANRNNGYELIYGTSFASPLTAGFAACALSLNPSMPAMQLFKEIEKSAHLFPYFDYAHGYGIPQAAYFLGKYGKREIPPFTIVNTSSGVEIRPENELPMNTRTNRYLGNRFMYVHIENDKAYLNRYWVFEIRDGETVSIPKNEMGANAAKMRVHLNGFTQTIDLK
jgi:subtilase family serine protease